MINNLLLEGSQLGLQGWQPLPQYNFLRPQTKTDKPFHCDKINSEISLFTLPGIGGFVYFLKSYFY